MSDFVMQDNQIFVRMVPQDGNKPVLRATFMINGVEYEAGLWQAKSGKAGSYSGKLKPKGERSEPQTKKQETIVDDMDQDIPF